MSNSTNQIRARHVETMLDSWRLEGFTPDDGFKALLQRYVDGEVDLEALRALIAERRAAGTQVTA